MKYTLLVYEEIMNVLDEIENATLDDVIKALNQAGMVSIHIIDENGKIVFIHYHEKLG